MGINCSAECEDFKEKPTPVQAISTNNDTVSEAIILPPNAHPSIKEKLDGSPRKGGSTFEESPYASSHSEDDTKLGQHSGAIAQVETAESMLSLAHSDEAQDEAELPQEEASQDSAMVSVDKEGVASQQEVSQATKLQMANIAEDPMRRYYVGQFVMCMDNDQPIWMKGIVTSVTPLLAKLLEDSDEEEGDEWDHIRPLTEC